MNERDKQIESHNLTMLDRQKERQRAERAEAELAEARARLAAVEAMLAAVAQVRRHYVDLDDISVLAEAVVRRLDAALARPEGAPDAE